MSVQRSFFILLILALLTGARALAQVHFTFTAYTGNNAIVAIQTSANPNISGTPLANGDEIGAFTPAGLCVGARIWSGTNTALTVWGDNDLTPTIDGIRAGEQISYRVWRQSTNTEYTNVNASYSQGNGIYAVNGTYVLSSLTAIGLPLTPTLTSPSNSATGIGTNPTLSWNASTGATSYQLQVSTSSSFTTTVVNQSGITATSYAVSGLTNSTVYYWRVNATNASGTSAYSSIWSFTTSSGGSLPAPTLLSPSNSATGVSITPTLSWNASTGATSYQLQVSTSSSFTTTVVNQSGITATSYAVSGLTNNTVYYWRVNATNAGGTSAYSTARSFTTIVAAPSAPTLSSPSNGATGVSTSPTVSWNASTGATSYQLQVSTSSSFTTTVVNQSGIATTSYAVSGLANNTIYYWRVNATNAGGTSAYSTAWSFTTIVAAPSAPTLSSPSNSATGVATNPTLSWNASTGATSYQLQVSTSSSFTTTVVNQSGITTTSYAASSLANNTIYYWRVNATNAGGTSAYSATWNFTTAAAVSPPAAPTLVSPTNGATGIFTSPTMSWNASSGATSYQLQVSSNSNFSTTVVNQTGITGTSYAVSGLTNNTVYYWRVNATNASGTSGYSSIWSFTTTILPLAPLLAPTLSSPLDGATSISTNPTLSWNEPSGVVSYQLQVSTSASFSTTLVSLSGITNTWFILSSLMRNTTYYWRVSAIYGDGAGPYSTVWSFTTVISAPPVPVLLEPLDGATGISTSPTLVWAQSTSALSYQLQVSTDSSFSATVLDQSGLTSTSCALTGLTENTTYFWHVNAANAGGKSEWSTVRSLTTSSLTGVNDWSGLPREIRLLQNYPNPFNNSTVIPFELSRAAYVSIEIYSVLGQKVASLEEGIKQAGSYRVSWGSPISSGVYYYRLVVDGSQLPAKKMIYLR